LCCQPRERQASPKPICDALALGWRMMVKNTRLDDFYRIIAKQYLKHFRNYSPRPKELKRMQRLLFYLWLPHKMVFAPELTHKEKQSLYYAAQGYTIKKTASLMETSVATIKHYRSKILMKLRCQNMMHAIMVGIKLSRIHD
jgi:DNA-binding NarL/FixJ family response regulator